MNYWLLKTEPSAWSWRDQLAAPRKTTDWTGVTNAAAQKNIRAMAKGDLAFFYHTGDEKQIVGIVQVSKAPSPDPSDAAGKLHVIDIRALRQVKKPVTLAQIKADAKLAHLALVKQSRLSVVPIDVASWQRICKMAETEL
ncbi:MAG: EVE domain-containing protein [Phycisphaeraceae bacterium]